MSNIEYSNTSNSTSRTFPYVANKFNSNIVLMIRNDETVRNDETIEDKYNNLLELYKNLLFLYDNQTDLIIKQNKQIENQEDEISNLKKNIINQMKDTYFILNSSLNK